MRESRDFMKKWIMAVTLSACLIGLSACGSQEPPQANSYNIYYVSNSETKVETRPYIMQSNLSKGQLDELISCLSTMPDKLEYKAPLAMGFNVLSVELEDGRVELDVSADYKKLSAIQEVLVRAAIVRTLTQLQDVDYVNMTVEGEPLYDSAGDLVGLMSANQFINNDGSEINTYELTRVMLYFANEEGDKLIAAYREKYYSTNTPLERFVVEELIAGPSGQVPGLYPTINPATKVINVMTRDGVCYVNLDSSFLTVVNNVSTEVAIYSIVNSLAELNNVNKVQILVNGEVPSTFSASSYERNLDDVTTLEN